jgi:hypothetical protein
MHKSPPFILQSVIMFFFRQLSSTPNPRPSAAIRGHSRRRFPSLASPFAAFGVSMLFVSCLRRLVVVHGAVISASAAILASILFLSACSDKPPAVATTQPPPGATGPTQRQIAATEIAPDMSDLKPIPDIGVGLAAKGPDGSDWQKFPSGLMMQQLSPGKGVTPAFGQTVFVAYVGTLPDTDKEFDRRSKDHPFSFRVGSKNVIEGWNLALPLMKRSSHWKIYIPPELAYGARGHPPKIGPNQPLLFEIELLAISGEEIKLPDDTAAKKLLDTNVGPTTAENPAAHLLDRVIGPTTAPAKPSPK